MLSYRKKIPNFHFLPSPMCLFLAFLLKSLVFLLLSSMLFLFTSEHRLLLSAFANCVFSVLEGPSQVKNTINFSRKSFNSNGDSDHQMMIMNHLCFTMTTQIVIMTLDTLVAESKNGIVTSVTKYSRMNGQICIWIN